LEEKVNKLRQRLKILKTAPSGLFAFLKKPINESRIKNINRKINKINAKIQKIKDDARQNRENDLTTARARLGTILDTEIPIINQEITSNESRIEELETEIKFRQLFN
jgi:hypothetical protein